MNPDLLDQLAQAEVPPVPSALDAAVHERLNRALLVGHMVEFGAKAMPYAVGHFARALMSLVTLTVTGRMTDDRRNAKLRSR